MNKLSKYVLLDAARMENAIVKAKELNTSFDSLYRGRSEEDLEAVAPYLFTFPCNDAFAGWIYEEGWGNSWGVIVVTQASFEDCWKHFRKFLMVKTEEGEQLYFRFYDPRVLKIFLPTCDNAQLLEFFGPVEKFIAEGDTKDTAIAFSLHNGVLQQSTGPASEIFGMAPAPVTAQATPVQTRRKRNIIIDDDLRDPK